MPAQRLIDAQYQLDNADQIPPHINGRGNNLPIFTIMYILMMPFIVYGCVTLFLLGIIEINIILSVGFGVVFISSLLSQ